LRAFDGLGIKNGFLKAFGRSRTEVAAVDVSIGVAGKRKAIREKKAACCSGPGQKREAKTLRANRPTCSRY